MDGWCKQPYTIRGAGRFAISRSQGSEAEQTKRGHLEHLLRLPAAAAIGFWQRGRRGITRDLTEIRKILTHLGEPLEPPPVSPARGPPIDWGKLVQIHDDREAVQVSPDELPVIDIHSL